MSGIRSLVRWFLQSALPVRLADFGGWLKLDHALEVTWRRASKRQIRRLHPFEILEAERVFGNSIPYERVRIYEHSPFARGLISLSNRVHMRQTKPIGATLFDTIHFSTGLALDHSDLPWLIHELTHVWQYHRYGPRYLANALRAQALLGPEAYEYADGLAANRPWEMFNPEQQADLVKAYYQALKADQDTTAFAPYVSALRAPRALAPHRV